MVEVDHFDSEVQDLSEGVFFVFRVGDHHLDSTVSGTLDKGVGRVLKPDLHDAGVKVSTCPVHVVRGLDIDLDRQVGSDSLEFGGPGRMGGPEETFPPIPGPVDQVQQCVVISILDVEEDFGPAFNVREIRLYPGDPFARERRVESASRIESIDFYGSQFVEPACTVRGPIDGGVVQDVELAVFAGPYVDLHVVDDPDQATVGGGEGVLGGDFVRAPVADDFDSRAGNGWGSRGLRCVS